MRDIAIGEFERDLRVVPLNGLSAMAKLPRGALLNWVFDQPDEESTYHLFVYLTARESQKVYEAPYDRGMLEVVRGKLANRGAILAVVRGVDADIVTRRYVIPADGLEHEFIADLMIAAKTVLEYSESVKAGAEAEITRLGGPRIEFAEASAVRPSSAHRSETDSYLTRLRTSAAQDRERRDAQNVRTIMRGTFA
ncbi:hypothetical protein [Nocardia asteroides]|uniref:hypothetical protein n=1 Tax=Nocardia asteroides TaxID=1824 RepID=UPI001E649695|nr:hypothetical protein [Nocardia asteroides]UGT59518.1 hypothetical protein LTT61_19945 [Nocardia asteroides]